MIIIIIIINDKKLKLFIHITKRYKSSTNYSRVSMFIRIIYSAVIKGPFIHISDEKSV